MCKMRFVIILFFSLFTVCISKAQITVTPSQTAAALAQKLAGPGVTISNATLTCAAQANGFFNVVSSNLGIDSGIVLTTGRAATQGSNYGIDGLSAYLASTDNGLAGDPMLDALAGQSTLDACDLEFDVIPGGDSIKFRYVFSSEEYKNAVCGPYNDAFAFFISGPGISGNDNMALVPGTNIPVTINTINDGVPGSTGHISNCTVMGPGSPFTAYYIDNSAGTTLTHQGLTTVLQAIHAVMPCNSYHLKIVIADAGDPLYDSGVFLQAGSLETDQYKVTAAGDQLNDTSGVFCVKGCLPGRFRIYSSAVLSSPQTIKFIIGGSAVGGYDYSAIADSVVVPAGNSYADVVINGLPTPADGIKEVKLFVLSQFACAGVSDIADSAMLLIYDTLHISMITPDTFLCGHENIQLRVNGDSILSYSWSPAAGLSNAFVEDPVAYTSASITYQVSASLPGSSCPAKTADVSLDIRLTPDVVLPADTTVCFNTQLALNAVMSVVNQYYSYSWSGPGSFTSGQLSPVLDTVSAKDSGIYTVTVIIDTNNCKASASIYLAVNTPDTPAVNPVQIFCLNKPADSLTATGTGLLWYTTPGGSAAASSPVPVTSEAGSYVYYVTQTIGNCESPASEIDVAVKKCCDGTILIPTAFTPNGDGRNDKFGPLMDYGYRVDNFFIYNRWGQVVYSGYDSWDGRFGGANAEVGTYFYKIEFGCILGGTTERIGDVTLIR